MSVQVLYTNNLNNKSAKNYVLFSNKNFNVSNLNQFFSKEQISFFKEIIKKKDSKKKFIIFDLNSKDTIILVKLEKNLKSSQIENLGAEFFNFAKTYSIQNLIINLDSIEDKKHNEKILEQFLHGLQLKSYEFNIYKSKTKNNDFKINIFSSKKNYKSRTSLKLKSLVEGTNFTRDLVSEPGNILHPDEYVKRLIKLKKYGLKVIVYDEKKLKKLGLNALVGVGQGSIRGSYLVTIEWNGTKSKSKPLAFVGKGVCFDTGGISLKPARFMEEMTYDMAGSAVVAGLMKNFALRKAKINAVGVVGLVENMPGGNAQRPGDIVKSYSGKTIEILNTDAEGRLVLADALSFTEKKFKPQFIVDLATLTGAIIVCLGEEYAGLFSNDDNISKKIFDAGEKVNEKVWRLPLHKNYDKLMDSKIADVQNINYAGGAGSITAAQFLQRFIVNKTPWVHLDIAGMAFSKKAANLNPGGATGFGVRLLNKFVEDNYE